MNVTDASIKLFTWFGEHDSFELDKDFISVVLVTDKETHDKAAVSCALKDLESSNIIQSSKIHDREVWVLRKPFNAYNQSIEVPAELAEAISSAINEFCELIEDKTDICDPASVSTKDIQNLVFLYRHVQDKLLADKKEES